MRRCIVILLLFVLPAQFSWAAAASYCQHAQDSTPQHLGHHEHQHQKASADAAVAVDALADAGTADGGPDSGLPGGHTDCAYCHFSVAKTLMTISPLLFVPPETPLPRAATEGATSWLFERIERPKWHRA